MNLDQVIKDFGINPENTGNRPRGWWIITEQKQIESEEESAGCKVGDLVVKTRDGASNPIDPEAFQQGNCIGSSEDDYDRTYRYYYYRKQSK